jgi:hypothetical protein
MAKTLTEQVVTLTGLPQEALTKEFEDVIKKEGFNPEALTLEELRLVLSSYLNEIFLEITSEEASPPS